jgi:hypothetical protein
MSANQSDWRTPQRERSSFDTSVGVCDSFLPPELWLCVSSEFCFSDIYMITLHRAELRIPFRTTIRRNIRRPNFLSDTERSQLEKEKGCLDQSEKVVHSGVKWEVKPRSWRSRPIGNKNGICSSRLPLTNVQISK